MFRSAIVQAVFAVALIAPAGRTHAQVVRGSVVDASGRGIAHVSVVAGTAANTSVASATSDSAGAFVITLPARGTYTLNASHIGYASAAPVEVQLDNDEEVDVRIRVDIDALRLAAIDVTARRRLSFGRAALYRRIEQQRQQGIGRFAVREDIERMRPQTATRLLSQLSPGLHVVETRDVNVNTVFIRRATGSCPPAIFVDGMRMNNRPFNANAIVDPQHLEAVEIYTGSAQIPVGYHDPQGCGTILFWTRIPAADDPGMRPVTWTRIAVAAVLAAGVVLLFR
jgi:hypothetical protein